ncbi:MAG: UDP-N-acetylmuramoyl-L-alanyl-D-glutamate--2,6-diaminopimelate ligase [Anaerolineae bacterium]|nr:UDP-N-acetylmuramoyl-L-alanyl-D-glutamate--2,6-diaminopimelate ligase [Anaerolineae bacterium]
MPAQTLARLVRDLRPLGASGPLNIPITGISLYADQAQPGDVFMTVRGVYRDGHQYIRQALDRGAVAVIGERSPDELTAQAWLPADCPYVQVADGRGAQAQVAAAFYGYPGQRLKMVGVTGTDGKTTTSNLAYAVLKVGGLKVGAVTTVSAKIGDQELDTGFHTTTPDAPDVQRYLAQMVAAGMEVVVLETTSHGLAQKRVDAIDFDVAVITNITHEHLDFHGSLEAYQQAKAELFRKLAESPAKPGLPKTAVLNADDSSIAYLDPIWADRKLRYGVERRRTDDGGPSTSFSAPSSSVLRPPSLDVYATHVVTTPRGLQFTAHTPVGVFDITSPLLGVYNVHNILAAISVGVALGVSVAAMQAGIASVRGIVGRMDPVDEGQSFIAVVDFAHTPNALAQALQAARAMTPGRVIVVFGSAGLRDRAKRRMMGEVAGRLADLVVVTAEDPRTESLDAIMAESVQAAQTEGKVEGVDLFRVADRGEAIYMATQMAQGGDIVLACGKGHEQSMAFGTTEYPWSDHAALRAALRGAPLRTLPTSQPGWA